MSNYAYNEQAQGLVNGVNKVFTVAHTIVNIESVRIGYAEYTNFTYSGKTITLGEAPLPIYQGVYVDYFYDGTSSTETPDINNFIYDEKLIGTVDGINTIFHSIYPVAQVDELRINSIPYTSFGVNGRTITLAAAPTAIMGSPRLDYYRTDVAVPTIDSGITMSQLRSSIYVRIGQTITSLQFPQVLVDEYIDEGVKVITKLKRDKRKRGVYSFKKGADSTATYEGSNSIGISKVSDYTPSKGIAVLNRGDVVYYNGKTDGSITSINNLEIDNFNTSEIQFGYRLSKNVEKISELFVDGYKLTPVDFAEYRHYNHNKDTYTIYNGYLFLPYSTIDGQVVTVVYYAKSTAATNETDIIDFDGDYISVIKTYVLWNIYHDREDDRADREKVRYKERLQEYKAELGKAHLGTSMVMQTVSPLNRFSGKR